MDRHKQCYDETRRVIREISCRPIASRDRPTCRRARRTCHRQPNPQSLQSVTDATSKALQGATMTHIGFCRAMVTVETK